MYFPFPLMQCRLSARYNKMEWPLLKADADIATCAEENMHAAGASHADCPTVALAAGFRGPMLFWCRVDGGGVALPHLMFLPLSEYMAVSSHSAVKVRPFSPAFPLAESKVKAFCRHSFGASRKKVSAIFYGTTMFFDHVAIFRLFSLHFGVGEGECRESDLKKGLTV